MLAPSKEANLEIAVQTTKPARLHEAALTLGGIHPSICVEVNKLSTFAAWDLQSWPDSVVKVNGLSDLSIIFSQTDRDGYILNYI